MSLILTFSLLVAFSSLAQSYLPVILAPGFGPSIESLPYKSAIEQLHPGTNVFIINILTGALSASPVWQQAEEACKAVKLAFPNNDSVHIIGQSQGSLISRALIQKCGINVVNWISIAGVHMGLDILPVSGFGAILDQQYLSTLRAMSTNALSTLFYTTALQNTLSLANVWRDGNRLQDYLTNCIFLPFLNNEVDHPNAAMFKTNFEKINKAILIAGPQDAEVNPWQSGHFGSDDGKGNITPMENQTIYTNNTLGLKTLDSRGDLHLITVPGYTHMDFANNATAILQGYCLQYLT